MKRILTLWLCLILLLSSTLMASPGNAVDISPCYTYISVMQAGLGILGSTANCFGFVASSSPYDISIRMTLMRYTGSMWVTVTYWTGSGSGVTGARLNKTYSLSVSGDYKIVVLGKILDDSGNVLESASMSSGIETY